MTAAYYVGENLYLNITNQCSADCDFCLRQDSAGYGSGDTLWLEREPGLEEILEAVRAAYRNTEIVFCGFGEPTMRLDIMLQAARELKRQYPGASLRLNTNGLGSLTAGRDIVPELAEVFDAVSVSLNFPDEGTYNERCRPAYPGAYAALLDFTAKCAVSIPNVTVTIPFPLAPEETEAARKIAESLGAEFRIR